MTDTLTGFLGNLAGTWGEVEKAKAEADAAKYTAQSSNNPPPEYYQGDTAVPDSQVQADAMRSEMMQKMPMALAWGLGALIVGVIVIKAVK